MCNWFPCHVPSFQWQAINNTALTQCSNRYWVFTVRALLFGGQRLCHCPDVISADSVQYNPTSSLWRSHMDLINYLNGISALWLSHTYGCFRIFAMQIWFWIWQQGCACVENMYLRCKNQVKSIVKTIALDDIHLTVFGTRAVKHHPGP